jgi:hypothetical protein
VGEKRFKATEIAQTRDRNAAVRAAQSNAKFWVDDDVEQAAGSSVLPLLLFGRKWQGVLLSARFAPIVFAG